MVESSKIFTVNGKEMYFCLLEDRRDTQSRKNYRLLDQLIEDHGGINLDTPTEETINLVFISDDNNHLNNQNGVFYDSRFIKDSVEKNKLQNLEHYRINKLEEDVEIQEEEDDEEALQFLISTRKAGPTSRRESEDDESGWSDASTLILEENKIQSPGEIKKKSVEEADSTSEIQENAKIKEEVVENEDEVIPEDETTESLTFLINTRKPDTKSEQVPVDEKEIVEIKKENEITGDKVSVSSFKTCCDESLADEVKQNEDDESISSFETCREELLADGVKIKQDEDDKSINSFETCCCEDPLSPKNSQTPISSKSTSPRIINPYFKNKDKLVKFTLSKIESGSSFHSLDYFTKILPKKNRLSPINSSDVNETLLVNSDGEKKDKNWNSIVKNPFYMASKKKRKKLKDKDSRKKKMKILIEQSEEIAEKTIKVENAETKKDDEEIVEKGEEDVEDSSLDKEENIQQDSLNDLEGSIVCETSFESLPTSTPRIISGLPALLRDEAKEISIHKKIPTELASKNQQNYESSQSEPLADQDPPSLSDKQKESKIDESPGNSSTKEKKNKIHRVGVATCVVPDIDQKSQAQRHVAQESLDLLASLSSSSSSSSSSRQKKIKGEVLTELTKNDTRKCNSHVYYSSKSLVNDSTVIGSHDINDHDDVEGQDDKRVNENHQEEVDEEGKNKIKNHELTRENSELFDLDEIPLSVRKKSLKVSEGDVDEEETLVSEKIEENFSSRRSKANQRVSNRASIDTSKKAHGPEKLKHHLSSGNEKNVGASRDQKPVEQNEPVVDKKLIGCDLGLDKNKKKPSRHDFPDNVLSQNEINKKIKETNSTICPQSFQELIKERKGKSEGKKNTQQDEEKKSPDNDKQNSVNKIKKKKLTGYSKPGPLSSKKLSKNRRKLFKSSDSICSIPPSDQENSPINKYNNKIKRPKNLQVNLTKNSEKSDEERHIVSDSESETKKVTPAKRRLRKISECSSDESEKCTPAKKNRAMVNRTPPKKSKINESKKVSKKVQKSYTIIIISSSSELDDDDDEDNLKANEKGRKSRMSGESDDEEEEEEEEEEARTSKVPKRRKDLKIIIVDGQRVEIPRSLEEPYPRAWMVGDKLYFKSDMNVKNYNKRTVKNHVQEWEQEAMIRFVYENNYFDQSSSVHIWEEMLQTNADELWKDRDATSLKDCWLNVILKNIAKFELPEEIKKKFNPRVSKRIEMKKEKVFDTEIKKKKS